jgi:S-adenosylmethionine synthetase
VDSYGTGKLADEELTALLRKVCDLTPAGIIRKLNLRSAIYSKTAREGHFGVADRPWENTDLVPALKELANI